MQQEQVSIAGMAGSYVVLSTHTHNGMSYAVLAPIGRDGAPVVCSVFSNSSAKLYIPEADPAIIAAVMALHQTQTAADPVDAHGRTDSLELIDTLWLDGEEYVILQADEDEDTVVIMHNDDCGPDGEERFSQIRDLNLLSAVFLAFCRQAAEDPDCVLPSYYRSQVLPDLHATFTRYGNPCVFRLYDHYEDCVTDYDLHCEIQHGPGYVILGGDDSRALIIQRNTSEDEEGFYIEQTTGREYNDVEDAALLQQLYDIYRRATEAAD